MTSRVLVVGTAVVIAAIVWYWSQPPEPNHRSSRTSPPRSSDSRPSSEPQRATPPRSSSADGPPNPPPDEIAPRSTDLVTYPRLISHSELWKTGWLNIEPTDTLVQVGPDLVVRLRLFRSSEHGLVPFQPRSREDRAAVFRIAESHEESEFMRDEFIDDAIRRGDAWGPFESRSEARQVLEKEGHGRIVRFSRHSHAVVDLEPLENSERFRSLIGLRKTLARELGVRTYSAITLDRP